MLKMEIIVLNDVIVIEIMYENICLVYFIGLLGGWDKMY